MSEASFSLSGNLVDVIAASIRPATISVAGGRIAAIRWEDRPYDRYLIPGLIDAHIHIESSMLVPAEFARAAVGHGTVAVVADPHEIANVLGSAGVRYMVQNGRSVPFKFYFGAPSCVPASAHETSGAVLDASQIEELFVRDDLKFLGEMMDYPGVLAGEPAVLAKLAAARRHGRPVDGHAPGLRGAALRRYLAAGISTDHEAFTLEEGLEKASLGMKILIREGTAARNFAALHPLIAAYPEQVMFCTDDRHPGDLLAGHLDRTVRAALALGYDRFQVLRCASLNPIRHYGLEVGLLQPGDPADFAVINNFDEFRILATYIDGQPVAEDGRSLIPRLPVERVNHFAAVPQSPAAFRIPARSGSLNVIGAVDGELVTTRLHLLPTVADGWALADPGRDLLKIAVLNRYRPAAPAVGFIHNFGLREGAIAASVAHDSHNIVAIGADDAALARAVNRIIELRGGLAAVAASGAETVLPLPVAGLMSDGDGPSVAADHRRLTEHARALGATMADPFMTMAFMTLSVIPALKISDRGLFDGQRFRPIALFGDAD